MGYFEGDRLVEIVEFDSDDRPIARTYGEPESTSPDLRAVRSARRVEYVERDELQAVQAPLKAHYRDNPGAALITLRAEGTLADAHVACSVATGQALVEAGLHPTTGGSGTLACSGDMLLQALAACAGVTLRAVATSLGLEVSGSVHAEGDLDVRGTLGVAKEEGVPVGFRAIRLRFELEHSESQETIERLLALTERYCVVLQTIAGGVPVDVGG